MKVGKTAVFYYNYGRSRAYPPLNIAEPLIMLAGRLSGSLFIAIYITVSTRQIHQRASTLEQICRSRLSDG